MNAVKGPENSAEETINRMIQTYEKDLLRLCCTYLKDVSLAEDAVQETFLKAYKHLHAFRGESSEKTWLIRIAINACRDVQRTNWFRNLPRMVNLDAVQVTQELEIGSELVAEIMKMQSRYVDETGIYQAGISPIPEAYVGVIRVPVTIPVTGSVTQLRGEAEFEGYRAKAELRLSEVDISGEILVTPESVLETADRPPEADVQGYALLADGVLVSDSWGARVWSAEDGAYRFEVRYALPESTQSLALRPVYRDGTMPEGEDIVLR